MLSLMCVGESLNAYGVNHVKPSPYYPEGNGQVEATSKTLLSILNRMVDKEPKKGTDTPSLVLSTYSTLRCLST